jgi:hypothetical protein
MENTRRRYDRRRYQSSGRSTCVSWWCGSRARTQAGAPRIQGELVERGFSVAGSTLWEILRRTGIEPSPRIQLDGFSATAGGEHPRVRLAHCRHRLLEALYIQSFIELASRRVHLAGITANPDGAGVTQQARRRRRQLRDAEANPRNGSPVTARSTAKAGSCQSRCVKSCGPSGSQDLALLAEQERRAPPFLRGSAPLPWAPFRNWSQPTATVSACFRRF